MEESREKTFPPPCVCLLSCDQLFAIFWTAACQAPLFMGFFRQGYWSGLPFSYSRGSSQPKIELVSPGSPISPQPGPSAPHRLCSHPPPPEGQKMPVQQIQRGWYQFCFFFFFLIFWPHHSSCGILVSWPGIEPVAPVGEAWGLNHWTPREVFGTLFFNCWS